MRRQFARDVIARLSISSAARSAGKTRRSRIKCARGESASRSRWKALAGITIPDRASAPSFSVDKSARVRGEQ